MIADTDEMALDLLRTPEAGGRVVRGGLIRGVGYAISTALGLATAALLLRHLGVADFGRFATVSAVLGIVAGVTDAGLTAVGGRELSVARTADERAHLLSNLLFLRIVGALLGVLGAVAFTVIAGYDRTMVVGTAIGGVGVILISVQSMLTVPIWVSLRIVSLTILEVLRNALTLAGVAVLVLAGAGLLPFLGIQIPVAILLIPVTVLLARVGAEIHGWRPPTDGDAAAARDAAARDRVRDERDLLPRARRARVAPLERRRDRPLRHVFPGL